VEDLGVRVHLLPPNRKPQFFDNISCAFTALSSHGKEKKESQAYYLALNSTIAESKATFIHCDYDNWLTKATWKSLEDLLAKCKSRLSTSQQKNHMLISPDSNEGKKPDYSLTWSPSYPTARPKTCVYTNPLHQSSLTRI
jgi:hypothetical protein